MAARLLSGEQELDGCGEQVVEEIRGVVVDDAAPPP
jgi:hypothetical protein